MHDRFRQIGFSQRIRLEWLERTANLVLAGIDERSIYSALQDLLEDKLSVGGNAVRGNREKAISILMKIWVHPPHDLHVLQREGLSLLSHLPRADHVAIHWGMAMAVYPFWGSVAAQVGRLLRLQGTAVASQVQRRVREQYGERETVSRATRRVLRSYVDWNVLRETAKRGIYSQGAIHSISHTELIAWLVEALLHAHPGGSVALATALHSTSLFPFEIQATSAESLAAASGRLEVLRHGLDQEMLMLRG
ncbi:MAG: hypothetical protein D6704_12255 [Nitrospirae bacterium]|nr:MAG: hypothetical protein D6704_12255 [Nitrospirota bacterium]